MCVARALLAAGLVVLTLAGCHRADRPHPAPGGAGQADECGADELGGYLGRLPSSEVMAAIATLAGHNRLRTIRPGDMVTQDFRPDRLNVEIGEDGRIERFRCG